MCGKSGQTLISKREHCHLKLHTVVLLLTRPDYTQASRKQLVVLLHPVQHGSVVKKKCSTNRRNDFVARKYSRLEVRFVMKI